MLNTGICMNLHSKRKFKENLTAFLFLAPFLTVFVVFLGYPVVYSFFLSLHKTTIYSNWYNKYSDMKFCGLEHYKMLLTQDTAFWWSLVATLVYACLTIPFAMALSLTLALILKPNLKGFSFFRSGFFLPNVFDMFVVGVIWLFLYNPTDGLFIKIIMNKGVNPIVHSLAMIMGFALFWLGPILLVWILLNRRRRSSSMHKMITLVLI